MTGLRSNRLRSGELVRGWTLFKIPSYQSSPYPFFDFSFTFLYLLFVIAIIITVIVIQLQNRPDEIRYKHVSNMHDLEDMPVGYHCDCKLPDYIEGISSLEQNLSGLRGCYSVKDGDVSTIIVVQFSNGTVPELLENVRNIDPNVVVREKQVNNGLIVSQDGVSWLGFANISGSSRPWPISKDFLIKIDPNNFDVPLTPKKILISQINGSIEDWGLGAELEFDCCNATQCAQFKQVARFCKKLNNNATSCPSSSKSKYHARCMLAAFTSKDRSQYLDLLQTVLNNSAIKNVGIISDSGSFSPSVSLLPELQLAVVKNSSSHEPVTYNFMEVEKATATWLQLQNSYPNVNTQCKDIEQITVCSMPTICSILSQYNNPSDPIYVECLEIPANVSNDQCKDLFAWKGNKLNSQELQELCKWKTNNCNETPGYALKSYSSVQLDVPTGDDAYSQLTGYIGKYNKKGYERTVCTNTYQQVVKYQERYLETTCSVDGLCHLTGRYHQINSMPFENMENLASESIPQPRFLCYTIRKQRLLSWGIGCAGTLGGLLGTIHTFAFFLYFAIVESMTWLRRRRGATTSSYC